MTAATMTRERFDLGRVIQRTFGVLGRNFLPFYLLALVLSGLPSILLQWLRWPPVAWRPRAHPTPPAY